MSACKCSKSPGTPPTGRWRIVNCTYNKGDTVVCLTCREVWRTKAKYANRIAWISEEEKKHYFSN